MSEFPSRKRHRTNTCVPHALLGNEPKSRDLQSLSVEMRSSSHNIIITASSDICNRNTIALRGAKESHLVMRHEFPKHTLHAARGCVAMKVVLWRMAPDYFVPIFTRVLTSLVCV